MGNLLKELAVEEQLAVRTLEAAELRAHNKAYEFKITVEAQLKTLMAEAQAKGAATVAHLQTLAKKYELDVENVGFDFERLVFVSKPTKA